MSAELASRVKADGEGEGHPAGIIPSGETRKLQQDRDHGDEDEATPLLAYAMEFQRSRKKIIFPLSDPHFVEVLLRSPACQSNRGANHAYSDLVARTRCCATCGKRIAGGFIRPYDTDPEGTMRRTRIVRPRA